MIFIPIISIIVLLYFIIEYSILIPKVNGLRVLMYHKIESILPKDALTVSTEQLERHFKLLQQKKYNCISLQDLIDYQLFQKPLPQNPFLLTLDDGYRNNLTQLYPLLLKYNFKAVIFLVANFINAEERNETGERTYLSLEEIKQMKPEIIEFALHSFDHKSYNDLSIDEINVDIQNTIKIFETFGINYLPCHAYTYGAYPKKDEEKRNKMYKILSQNNVELAFRIGNRVNTLPLENPYLIQRIDVRGTDSFFQFKAKIRTGRAKLFG